MKTGSRILIGIVSGLILGAVAGVLAGWHLAMETSTSPVLNMALQKDAINIRSQVAALKYLREGKTDEAAEEIENNMDDTLILFDPAEPYPGISERTSSDVAQAIRECKEYREQYPRSSSRPPVDKMVRSVLEQGELN